MNEQPKPAYRPVSVQDAVGYDALKGAHRIKRVNVVFDDGTTTYIEIPHDEYTADRVRTALEDAYQQHAEVMSLQGPPAYPGQPVTLHKWAAPPDQG